MALAGAREQRRMARRMQFVAGLRDRIVQEHDSGLLLTGAPPTVEKRTNGVRNLAKGVLRWNTRVWYTASRKTCTLPGQAEAGMLDDYATAPHLPHFEELVDHFYTQGLVGGRQWPLVTTSVTSSSSSSVPAPIVVEEEEVIIL